MKYYDNPSNNYEKLSNAFLHFDSENEVNKLLQELSFESFNS
jgi:hypothetical protein